MNHSMPGLPVHHQLPEFTQTHVHRVGDAIQPSHPLSSPSPPAPNPSQPQGLFQWVNSSHEGQSTGVSTSASVLPMNTQDWFPLGWTDRISLQSKGLSRVFSNTTVQKYLMNSMKRQNNRILKEEFPRLVGAQYATGDQWRNHSRKNEGMEAKQKQYPVVDGTGDRSKVWCCKEQYCIVTWNVRSMNQGKLEVVKQEMARVNLNVLGISKLKWIGMGEFNSDDHCIYYCGQ